VFSAGVVKEFADCCLAPAERKWKRGPFAREEAAADFRGPASERLPPPGVECAQLDAKGAPRAGEGRLYYENAVIVIATFCQ
jgi:hypothetical protein